MPRERLGEHASPLLALRLGQSVVHVVWREQPEPDVMVFGVVPVERVAAEAAAVLERTEAVREVGPLSTGTQISPRVGSEISPPGVIN